MLINPIASGSSGNAYYISDGQSSLLLDAGIPLAQIQAGCGYKVSQLSDLVEVVLKSGEKDEILAKLDEISGYQPTMEDVAKN